MVSPFCINVQSTSPAALPLVRLTFFILLQYCIVMPKDVWVKIQKLKINKSFVIFIIVLPLFYRDRLPATACRNAFEERMESAHHDAQFELQSPELNGDAYIQYFVING